MSLTERGKLFVREELSYDEGTLVEVILTGERFLFGRAEYGCNWHYSVWAENGNYMGNHNAGHLRAVTYKYEGK